MTRHHVTGRAWRAGVAGAVLGLGASAPAQAHFQELIPDPPLLTESQGRSVALSLSFTHPMANGPVMPMGKPVRFGVLENGTPHDLTATLESAPRDGQPAFRARYDVAGPGDYVFFVEPQAYWEPAEQVMIVHYTKVILDAFGADEGWDTLVGLPVEIKPLTRPYGLYAGSVFSGVVLRDGQPVPFATVEVEYRSEGKIKPPADIFETQVLRADAAGTFHIGLPRAGWWGIAALVEGSSPMKNPEGREVPVEQGGLLWVHAVEMPKP